MASESSLFVDALRGLELSSIEFVRDYLQLRFDGPYLTVLTPITVYCGEAIVAPQSPGWRDALCDQIGRRVQDAELCEGRAFILKFEDGVEFSISLRIEDYVGPEALIIQAGDDWDVIADFI